MLKRIFSLFFVFSFSLLSVATPVRALEELEVLGAVANVLPLGDWLYNQGTKIINFGRSLIDDDVCGGADSRLNTRHKFVEQHTQVDGKFGIYYVCENCGKSAGEVFEPAYQEYTKTLPAQQVNSNNTLMWSPPVLWCGWENSQRYYCFGDYPSSSQYKDFTTFSSDKSKFVLDMGPFSIDLSRNPELEPNVFASIPGGDCYCYFQSTVPVPGYYTLQPGELAHAFFHRVSSAELSENVFEVKTASNRAYYSATSFLSYQVRVSTGGGSDVQYIHVSFYQPVYLVEPFDPADFDVSSTSNNSTYNVNTRAASITGDYGIMNENGTVTKIGTQKIVNETNNSVYNPVTNTTQNFTDWNYDYSDRSYNLTLESGDTMTVTYGDENITINEGGTTYNVYYISEYVPPTPTPTQPPHVHHYTSDVTTNPTCTLSGVRTYTCSGCGDIYTQAIPATGHAWEIKQQVSTQYDDTGQLLQQGYTVYRCAACGEEYRSDDTTAPPGGQSTSVTVADDPELLEYVSMVKSWGTGLKESYTGYVNFLGDLFPYLPPELLRLFYFGLASMVFTGLFRRFFWR